MSATNDLTKIINKLQKTVKQAVSRAALKEVGIFARDIVVKRTRLGYGVESNFGSKEAFAGLSDKYKKRRASSDLSPLTRPNKSNLTNTGQMLASMKSFTPRDGTIEIRPTGKRDDGYTNEDIAEFNAIGGKNRPPRVFNFVSNNEYFQIIRFYRRTFTDLLKKVKL